jgi:hypothetical protein
MSGRTDNDATSDGRPDLDSAHSTETGKDRTEGTDKTLAGIGSFMTCVALAY